MAKQHKIEAEITKATAFKPKAPIADRNDYLIALAKAGNKLDDDKFEKLTDAAANWITLNVKKMNEDEDLLEFDDEELQEVTAAEDDGEAEEASSDDEADEGESEDEEADEDAEEAEEDTDEETSDDEGSEDDDEEASEDEEASSDDDEETDEAEETEESSSDETSEDDADTALEGSTGSDEDSASEEADEADEDHEADAEEEAEAELQEAKAAKTVVFKKGAKKTAKKPAKKVTKAPEPSSTKKEFPTDIRTKKRKAEERTPERKKFREQELQRYEDVNPLVKDRYGYTEGTKTSEAILMYEKGTTSGKIKEKLDGRFYNVLTDLEKKGHKVERLPGGLFRLTHRDDVKAGKKK